MTSVAISTLVDPLVVVFLKQTSSVIIYPVVLKSDLLSSSTSEGGVADDLY
jgi:hypothetical protein